MKYLEDFENGMVVESRTYDVTKEEIVAFAAAYDPQPFHTDEAYARETQFGQLIASGWHTCAIAMRLLVDSVLGDTAGIASPGVDEIRWLRPVCPGDVLHLRWTVQDVKPSRSKPDRGVVRALSELVNQDGETVMRHIGMSMVHKRAADS